MSRLEFIALGDQHIPGVPLRCVPLAEPSAHALYERRLEAAMSSEADYICFVDGGDDVCLPGFVYAMQSLADQGQPLGYATELVHGVPRGDQTFSLDAFLRDFSIIHHGVVCRVSDLKSLKWPEGCYCWEVIAYGSLAARGHVFDRTPRYDWRPGPGGARLWPGYTRGVVNSLRWLQGLPGTHFSKDFRCPSTKTL